MGAGLRRGYCHPDVPSERTQEDIKHAQELKRLQALRANSKTQAEKDALRARFLEKALSYQGIPYSRGYHPDESGVVCQLTYALKAMPTVLYPPSSLPQSPPTPPCPPDPNCPAQPIPSAPHSAAKHLTEFARWNSIDPFHDAPLYLDCCGLVRRVLRDLKDDFGFEVGRWNQAYQVRSLCHPTPAWHSLARGCTGVPRTVVSL